jgi:hypothetical protein
MKNTHCKTWEKLKRGENTHSRTGIMAKKMIKTWKMRKKPLVRKK